MSNYPTPETAQYTVIQNENRYPARLIGKGLTCVTVEYKKEGMTLSNTFDYTFDNGKHIIDLYIGRCYYPNGDFPKLEIVNI